MRCRLNRSKAHGTNADTASVITPRPHTVSPSQNPSSAEMRSTSSHSTTPMPPHASPSTSMAKSVAGSARTQWCTQCSASSIVYGEGNRSRTISQIRRLSAWRESDEASSTRQSRMMHVGRTRYIDGDYIGGRGNATFQRRGAIG
jgi:hypothetical protein